MSETLKQHIKKFIEISDEDFHVISQFFKTIKLKKKENVLIQGQICRSNYFILEGCLRMFFINAKDSEQTTQFAIENWWISDYLAFSNQKPTEFNIQAVEPSKILSISYDSQEQLLEQFPQMERYFRLIYQRAYSASQLKLRYLYDLSREEHYHYFKEHFPEFVQRIPQYLLASFLGFTPEYLSEIRKKKLS